MKFLKKYVLPALGVLAALVVSSHYLWKYSGDGEWKKVDEGKGVVVYTQKLPGESLVKIKANMTVATRLSTAVFALRGDEATQDDFDGENFTVIEKNETPDLYMAIYSVDQVMPPPLGTKEIVMMLSYAQDKETGQVVINVQGAPGIVPPKLGVERLTHVNNTFTVTPNGDGTVDWEMIMDADVGIPYFLFNLAMPAQFVEQMAYMQEVIQKEKYRDVELISVAEI